MRNPDIRRQVLAYLDASALLSWDLVRSEFLNDSEQQWGLLAHSHFGLRSKSGKKGWALGMSLVARKPIVWEMADTEDFGHGASFAGSPHTDTNQSIVATVSDNMDNAFRGEDFNSFPVDENVISLRDAQTLNFIRTIPCATSNWRVAICGHMGCEIFVTSNHNSFRAI